LDASASVLSSSAINNRYKYTGREWDATLELHHFRARWMSGLTGRFLTRDPIGFEGSEWNLYEFVKSNTGNSIDPSGLVKCNASDHAICDAACKRQGKPGGMAEFCFEKEVSYWLIVCTVVDRVRGQKCKCIQPDDECLFYYLWCKFGAKLPIDDPGKPFWPKKLNECDDCYKDCTATGKWNCVKGGGKKGPRFPGPKNKWNPVWPDGPFAW